MGYGELSNTQETMVLPLLQMKNIRGKPYITVSAKGMINGLSNIPNDGADFGPDTTLNATGLGQYGSPYTETSGGQEGVDYVSNLDSGGVVRFSGGKFIINSTINIENTSAGDVPIYLEGSGAGNFGNQTYPNISTSQGTLFYAADGLNANIIYVDNLGGYLKISDIHFFGNPDNNTGSSIAIITFADGFQSEVSRCIFDSPPESGYAIFTTDGNDLSFLNINKNLFQNAIAGITAHDNGMIYLNPLSSSNQTSGAGPYIIEDNYFFSTAATHIYTDAPNTIIRNNFFDEYINAVNTSAINAQVTGNIFLGSSSSSSAYQVAISGQNAQVHGNFFLYAGYQNILVNGGNAEISENMFDGTAGDSSSTATTKYVLNITAALASVSKGGIVFRNNTFIGPYLSSFPFNYVSDTGLIIRDNYVMSDADIVLAPTLSTNPPVTATVYQNTNPYDIYVSVPITFPTTASTAMSAYLRVGTSSTAGANPIMDQFAEPATLATASGRIWSLKAKIPAGQYFEVDTTNASIGTAVVAAA